MPQEEQSVKIDNSSMTNSGMSEEDYYKQMEESEEVADSAYTEPGFSVGEDMLDDDEPPDDYFIEPDDVKERPEPREVPDDSEEYYAAMASISAKGDIMSDDNELMIAGDEFASDEMIDDDSSDLMNAAMQNPLDDGSGYDSKSDMSPEFFEEGSVDSSAYNGPANTGVGFDDENVGDGGFQSDNASGQDDGVGGSDSSSSDEPKITPEESVGRDPSTVGNVGGAGDESQGFSSGSQVNSSGGDTKTDGTDEGSQSEANAGTTEPVNGSSGSNESGTQEDGSNAAAASSAVQQEVKQETVPSTQTASLQKHLAVAKASVVKKGVSPSGTYSQVYNRPSVQKTKEQDISYRMQRKNQLALENADALNKDILASVELIRQMNLNVVDALAKFNGLEQKMRAVIKDGNDVSLRMDQLISKSNNMFTDKYMDNIQKTCERNLSSYIESSRSNYIELFKIAVRDYRNFSDAAMKFQRGMEAKFSNEFRNLVKIIYLLPFLLIINIALLAVVIWRLMF